MTVLSYHLRGLRSPARPGLAALLLPFCLALLVLNAQDRPLPERFNTTDATRGLPVFFGESNLVTVSFTFRPNPQPKRLWSRGAPELHMDDIEVLDNGVPRKVAVLEQTGNDGSRPPTDVILLFDCGRDFRPYLNPKVVNLGAFEELENVRFSIYAFSDSAYRLLRPTADMAQLSTALHSLSRLPFVPSVHRDAMVQTIEDAVSIPGSRPRMLVVFSNFTHKCRLMSGNPDRHSWDDVVEIARRHDIALFPVVVSERRLLALAGFGEATGGKTLQQYAVTESILQQVLKYYRAQTRTEYVAGFYPGAFSGSDGELHRLVVRLKNDRGEITGGVRTAAYHKDRGGPK